MSGYVEALWESPTVLCTQSEVWFCPYKGCQGKRIEPGSQQFSTSLVFFPHLLTKREGWSIKMLELNRFRFWSTGPSPSHLLLWQKAHPLSRSSRTLSDLSWPLERCRNWAQRGRSVGDSRSNICAMMPVFTEWEDSGSSHRSSVHTAGGSHPICASWEIQTCFRHPVGGWVFRGNRMSFGLGLGAVSCVVPSSHNHTDIWHEATHTDAGA